MKEKKHSAGRSVLFCILTLVLLAALIVVLNSPVMNVRTVTVTGNSRFSADEIIAASGITSDTNILKVDEAAAAAAIEKNSYLEVLHITRTFPWGVEITVREREPIAFLPTANGCYLLDKNCCVLACVEQEDSQLVRVTGMDLTQPETGKTVTAVDENKVVALSSILQAVDKLGYHGRIIAADISSISSATVVMDGCLTIKLGKASTALDKLAMLPQILEELGQKAATGGVLDMTGTDKYFFDAAQPQNGTPAQENEENPPENSENRSE